MAITPLRQDADGLDMDMKSFGCAYRCCQAIAEIYCNKPLDINQINSMWRTSKTNNQLKRGAPSWAPISMNTLNVGWNNILIGSTTSEIVPGTIIKGPHLPDDTKIVSWEKDPVFFPTVTKSGGPGRYIIDKVPTGSSPPGTAYSSSIPSTFWIVQDFPSIINSTLALLKDTTGASASLTEVWSSWDPKAISVLKPVSYIIQSNIHLTPSNGQHYRVYSGIADNYLNTILDLDTTLVFDPQPGWSKEGLDQKLYITINPFTPPVPPVPPTPPVFTGQNSLAKGGIIEEGYLAKEHQSTASENNVNKSRQVVLYKINGKKDDKGHSVTLIGDTYGPYSLSEEFSYNINHNFESGNSLIGNMADKIPGIQLGKNLLNTVATAAMATGSLPVNNDSINFIGALTGGTLNKMSNVKGWIKSEPLSFSIKMNFNMGRLGKFDAYSEVYAPIMELIKLCLPEDTEGGYMKTPGLSRVEALGIALGSYTRSILQTATGGKDSTANYITDALSKTESSFIGISLYGGQFVISPCYVKIANYSFGPESDTSGYPTKGSISLTLETIYMSNSADLYKTSLDLASRLKDTLVPDKYSVGTGNTNSLMKAPGNNGLEKLQSIYDLCLELKGLGATDQQIKITGGGQDPTFEIPRAGGPAAIIDPEDLNRASGTNKYNKFTYDGKQISIYPSEGTTNSNSTAIMQELDNLYKIILQYKSSIDSGYA